MARLDGKQIAIVVGQKNYNDEEYTTISQRLEEEGADICIASNSLEKALGRIQGHLAPDCRIEDVDVDEFDAVILIGGYGARVYLWDDEEAHALVRRSAKAGKLVAAIGTAPVVLANAGVLENKQATVYPDYESALALEEQGAQHVHEYLVTDGNIVTVNHSRFADRLADKVVEHLEG